MKSSTVDVVIPTHNGMPWIMDAIDSVLKQSYKDLELYVIDDGSTDNTQKAMKSIIDPRLHYVRVNENKGASATRNRGIAMGTSPYVALLDADDKWHSTKLEKQMAIMSHSKEVCLVYCGIYVTDESGNIVRNLLPSTNENKDAIYEGNNVTGSASAVVISRKALEESGLFNEDLVNGEDWELWIRLSRVGDFAFTQEILVDILGRSNSVQSNVKRMADELIKTYDYIASNHNITHTQKVHLATYCLMNSVRTYMHLREYGSAKKTLFKFLKVNKHAFFTPSNWRIRIAPPYFLTVFLAGNTTSLLNSITDRVWRKLDWIYNKIYVRIKR